MSYEQLDHEPLIAPVAGHGSLDVAARLDPAPVEIPPGLAGQAEHPGTLSPAITLSRCVNDVRLYQDVDGAGDALVTIKVAETVGPGEVVKDLGCLRADELRFAKGGHAASHRSIWLSVCGDPTMLTLRGADYRTRRRCTDGLVRATSYDDAARAPSANQRSSHGDPAPVQKKWRLRPRRVRLLGLDKRALRCGAF
ncbi:MAG: hypothetical protein M3R71_02315 [Actinomycetota bacterium]|nr:hypothetical protein [Actinomycetota bacterium]